MTPLKPASSNPVVLISCGGTGGHLVPGLGLGRYLKETRGIPVVYLVNDKPILERFTGRFNAPCITVPEISPSDLRRFRLRRFYGNCRSVWRELRCLGQDQDLSLVISAGSGAGALPVLFGRLHRIPAVLLEQNRIPGRANRFLFPWVQRMYFTFPPARGALPAKGRVLGNPVLAEAPPAIDRRQAAEHLGLKADGFTVLFLGGSQGARKINEFALLAMQGAVARRANLQVIHLTGPTLIRECQDLYRRLGIPNFCREFSEDMPSIYRLADLAVSRAGGGVLAELFLYGVPSLLVPYPFSADGHQDANAAWVTENKAGWMINDSELLNGESLDHFWKLLEDDSRLAAYRKASLQMAAPDAARRIADDLAEFLPGGDVP